MDLKKTRCYKNLKERLTRIKYEKTVVISGNEGEARSKFDAMSINEIPPINNKIATVNNSKSGAIAAGTIGGSSSKVAGEPKSRNNVVYTKQKKGALIQNLTARMVKANISKDDKVSHVKIRNT